MGSGKLRVFLGSQWFVVCGGLDLFVVLLLCVSFLRGGGGLDVLFNLVFGCLDLLDVDS